jgi:hypothetical protein
MGGFFSSARPMAFQLETKRKGTNGPLRYCNGPEARPQGIKEERPGPGASHSTEEVECWRRRGTKGYPQRR